MNRITLPELGKEIKAATVVRWLKAEGEAVAEGELLLLAETEQATVQVVSPVAGTVRACLCPAGRTVPVSAPLAILGVPGEDVTKAIEEGRRQLEQMLAAIAPAVEPPKAAAPPSAPPRPAAQPAAPAAGAGQTPPLKKEEKKMASDKAPVEGPKGDVIPVLMPQAGNSMEEGTILKWHVRPGDTIEKGQVLCEIETDKASVELEATDAGRLARIVAAEGTIVPVKEPVAYLAASDADVEAWLAMQDGGVAPAAAAAPAAAPAAPKAPAEGPKGEVFPVLMPQAGNSMEEGTILKWHVQPGDVIEKGQVLFEIETDKATVEVESTDAGRLARIVAAEGAVVAVKHPVAFIAESDADVDAWLAVNGAGATPAAPVAAAAPAPQAPACPAAPAPRPQAAPAPARPATPAGGRPKASPAARRVAQEMGIDLGRVATGSGPRGRILSTDVATARPQAPSLDASQPPVRTRMSNMRRAIAKNLSVSKQTIPHFQERQTINADPLMAFYRSQKAKYPVSVNDVIVAACSRCMVEFAPFRSQLDGNDIVEFQTVNIGVAVGMEDGLTVPVIMHCDQLTLSELAAEARRVIESARSGKLENLGQGLFTISNLGMFGIEEFNAIINPPEAAILAVSAVREAVIVKDGAMRPGRVMTMTLSSDHRLIDGLVAARFMARLRELLEDPEQLLY